jgi:class 3 adenylate cyclase
MADRRRFASYLLCDLTGSTALAERLDAEAVRELMFRYFAEVRAIIERHGGTVEKYVGDAVHGVFGVPFAHEDDAVRAVRAAAELRAAIAALNPDLERRYGSQIAVRVGVDTGEVVAGDPSTRQAFVSGDAVNTATRLQQAADPGDVLIGAATYALVCDSVEAVEAAPVVAKGKSLPLEAWRLLDVHPSGPARPQRARVTLVGRSDELATLRAAFTDAVTDQRCVVSTVLGEPGIGKSHLATELLDGVAAEARTASGRCLSYGEGVTWWPLREILRDALEIGDDDGEAALRAGLEGAAGEDAVARTVGIAIGATSGSAAAEEIPWALRRLLATLARRRPLALLVDDIQWAEPTLLDFLARLPSRLTDVPLFVLCLARPELLEQRSDWEVSLKLRPLGEAASRELLLLRGVDRPAADRLTRAAAGNYLPRGMVERSISTPGVLAQIAEPMSTRCPENRRAASGLPSYRLRARTTR